MAVLLRGMMINNYNNENMLFGAERALNRVNTENFYDHEDNVDEQLVREELQELQDYQNDIRDFNFDDIAVNLVNRMKNGMLDLLANKIAELEAMLPDDITYGGKRRRKTLHKRRKLKKSTRKHRK